MGKRVLTDRDDTCVWIEIKDGKLLISGQVLRGGSEYEYFITVESKDFDTIRDALGAPDHEDMIDMLRAHREEIYAHGESTWLKSLGIEFGFSNYFDADFFEKPPSFQ